jgi:pimeloyl-ACP methyl ester carboxylesterase
MTPLARKHRVLVVDLKGFGASAKPRDEFYRPQDQAELLFELVLNLDLQDFVLVGHSLGGAIASLVAVRLMETCPQRLRALIVVAGPLLPQPVPPFLRLAGRRVLGPVLLRILPARFLIRKGLRLAYKNPDLVSESLVEAYAGNLRSKGGRHALSATVRQLQPLDAARLSGELSSIRVPVLLLWGNDDPVVPVDIGERAAALFPHAILQVLPECGHMPQEEHPSASMERVTEFLRDTVSGVSA